MTITNSATLKELFTEKQWNLIYDFIGNALDSDDDFDDDVYAIRDAIHQMFSN